MGVDYSTWKPGVDYPEWMNEVSLATISNGYLLPDENPKKAYKRVADAVAKRLDRPDLANKLRRLLLEPTKAAWLSPCRAMVAVRLPITNTE